MAPLFKVGPNVREVAAELFGQFGSDLHVAVQPSLGPTPRLAVVVDGFRDSDHTLVEFQIERQQGDRFARS